MTNPTPTATVEDAIKVAKQMIDICKQAKANHCVIEPEYLETLIAAATHPQPQSAGCEGLVMALQEAREYSLGSAGEDCTIYKIIDAALKSFKSPPVADKWRDISTAPMDGNEILAKYFKNSTQSWQYRIISKVEPLEWTGVEYIWEARGESMHDRYTETTFTHWKPLETLPEPPVAGGI